MCYRLMGLVARAKFPATMKRRASMKGVLAAIAYHCPPGELEAYPSIQTIGDQRM
jgi:hypothetical protein